MSTLKTLVLSKDERNQIEKEYNMVAELIPTEGISVQQRGKLKAKIRNLLPIISNSALASLMVLKKHQLSRKEFCNRLKSNNFTFREICIILDRLWAGQRIFRKLLLKLADKLSDLANTISREEMIHYAEIFAWEEIGQNTDVLFKAIIQRDDAENILKELMIRNPLCFKRQYIRFKNS